MTPSVVLVAHRAGNDPERDVRLTGPADLVELDVHRFRGRLEVRHAKALWPSQRLFEGWTLLPRSTPRPTLAQVLAAIPQDRRLWLDLKGPDPRLAAEVARAVGDRPVWVSARCWWQLARFRSYPHIRTFASIGTKWQRWLIDRLHGNRWCDGLVIHQQLVDPVFMWRRAPGTPVAVWAVDRVERALELLSMGVTGLILDDEALIDELRDVIDAGGGR